MSNVVLEIPEQFARTLGATEEEAAKNARLELACSLYREGKWSSGMAASFVGMTRLDFMDLLRDRNIPVPYTEEMLEQDIAYARSRVG